MPTEEKTAANVYSFILTRPNDYDGKIPHITDFHYVAFIRNPILKQSTYIDIQAVVPMATIIIIENEINNGKFPLYELSCYELKNIDKINESDKNIQKLIYTTFVNIVNITKLIDNNSPDRILTEGSIPTRMLVVDPVSYQMSQNTGFNYIFGPKVKEHENDTEINPHLIALETIINNSFNPQIQESKLMSFMDYVIKKYSAQFQNIKQHVLADKNCINFTKYDQIMVPPTLPEINVPEYIINTYKPFNSPTFWFFDIFNFANYDNASTPSNGKIPIWSLLINFFNCFNIFKKIDISTNVSITMNTKLLKTEQFIDNFGIFNRPNAIVNFISPNMTHTQVSLGETPNVLRTDNSYKKQTSRITSMKVYYPDSLQYAKKRIEECRKIFIEQIDRIEHYETTLTTPDWLQFGQLYNLEFDTATGINTFKYIHTPIAIINIFKRREMKDDTLECINKYTMIRLVNKS
ncbi:MAG: hypothetical protein WC188_03950 [Candidatus Caldatribacteriota bacterium]|nr:hypothetical protein [Patescibacteria group bacterium]